MRQPTDERLDRFFSGLCSRAEPHRMPSSVWPELEPRTSGWGRLSAWRLVAAHPLLAPSCAAALIMGGLLWAHPGFAAEVVERIRKMFSGTFELQIGAAKPVTKEMLMENGKPSTIEIAGKAVTLTMSDAGDGAVLIAIRVAEKSRDGSGRVLAKPKIVTRKGYPAEVTVSRSDTGAPIFRVKVVPTDAPDKAIGSISEVK